MGAIDLSILKGATFPDAAPPMINTSLFALGKAVRSSVVLGSVGIGGELKAAFDLFIYLKASPIIVLLFILVRVMKSVTGWPRAKIQ